jgi:hypothetical protein
MAQFPLGAAAFSQSKLLQRAAKRKPLLLQQGLSRSEF